MLGQMSKFAAVLLSAGLLAATPAVVPPVAAAEAPHRIARDAAWGCRDKNELIDLLFLGISASFDSKLATALADGRCAFFRTGETVTIVENGGHGLVKVQRGGASPVAYWTALRNVE
jgi:hypothetical protein